MWPLGVTSTYVLTSYYKPRQSLTSVALILYQVYSFYHSLTHCNDILTQLLTT